MKIAQLRYFQSVCKYGNFTQAAKECYVSQPAVSAAVRELEEEFGLRLFDRSTNKLLLTEEGRIFLDRCDNILDYVDKTGELMCDLGLKHNRIKIGIPPMIGTFFFPPLFNDYRAVCPDVAIELYEAGSLQVRQSVLEGSIDLGVAILNEINDDSFEALKTVETELVFCVGEGHPLADRKTVDFSELSGKQVILFKDDSYQNKLIKNKAKEENVDLDVILYSSQLNTIREMLCYGNCGAFLFKQVADTMPEIRAVLLSQPLKMEIGLLWNKNSVMYSDCKRFVDFVASQKMRRD